MPRTFYQRKTVFCNEQGSLNFHTRQFAAHAMSFLKPNALRNEDSRYCPVVFNALKMGLRLSSRQNSASIIEKSGKVTEISL